MKCFIKKMKGIINSKEFYKDTKEYFDYFYFENEQDENEAFYEIRDFLYSKYFKKFEDEYYLLEKAEYDF